MKEKLTLLVLVCLSLNLFAQEEQEEAVHAGFDEPEKAKNWAFSVTPYALLAAQSTDVGGEKIRQSFSDLSSMTNAGFQVITGIRYKRWNLSWDGTFATLGVEEMQGPLNVDVEIIQRIHDFKLSYLVYDNFEISEQNVLDGWSLEISAGGKYWKNDVNINYSLIVNDNPILNESFRELQEWWDLMIGAKTRFVISPKFLLVVAYNVGGFGLGDSSEFSHDLTYVNSFKVHKHLLINAGFRGFRYRQVDGEGDEELETVVNVLGPMLGVSVAF
jgi:hypothetical protein